MATNRKLKPGPEPQFSETRGPVKKNGKLVSYRLSIVVTEKQLEAVKEVVEAQNAKHTGPRQTASSWGLQVILESLRKEGYKDW
jgi:hypothetical protein